MTEPVIMALTRLHYGADYLDAVIRSTEGFAEKHIVIYTPNPSFGQDTTLPCPDDRDTLLAIAEIAGGDRLHWVEAPTPGVDVALQHFPHIDLLLELDGDEVIHQDLARDIRQRFDRGELTARRYRLPMVHHWRSFHYVCTDGQWPVRLYLPGNHPDVSIEWYPRVGAHIHHFGYARRLEDMRYKWAVSLHKPEMRPEWWETFASFPDRLTDLHPVSNDGFWNAEPFSDSGLPAVLINHPYRYLEVIE